MQATMRSSDSPTLSRRCGSQSGGLQNPVLPRNAGPRNHSCARSLALEIRHEVLGTSGFHYLITLVARQAMTISGPCAIRVACAHLFAHHSSAATRLDLPIDPLSIRAPIRQISLLKSSSSTYRQSCMWNVLPFFRLARPTGGEPRFGILQFVWGPFAGRPAACSTPMPRVPLLSASTFLCFVRATSTLYH